MKRIILFVKKKMEKIIMEGNLLKHKIWVNCDKQFSRSHDLPAHISTIKETEERSLLFEWMRNNEYDRKRSLPACIQSDGCKHWYEKSKKYKSRF